MPVIDGASVIEGHVQQLQGRRVGINRRRVIEETCGVDPLIGSVETMVDGAGRSC